MSKLQAINKDQLTDAPSTPNITRRLAFGGEEYRVIRSSIDPGTASGWHHHGDHDVYGYVARGTARFEGGPGGRDAITVNKGDFFHVPARVVHRDVNPSPGDDQEVIIFLRGSGPVVVNVDGPEPE